MARRRRLLTALAASSGVVIVLVASIVTNSPPLLGIAAFGGSMLLARAIWRDNRRRGDEYSRHCAAIAAQADRQNDWVIMGDDRGVFGPQGVELMRFVTSKGSASQADLGEQLSPEEIDKQFCEGPATGEHSPEAASCPSPKPLSLGRRFVPAAIVASGVLALVLLSPTVSGPSSPTKFPPAHQPPRPLTVVDRPADEFSPPQSESSSSQLPPSIPGSESRTTPYLSCEEAKGDGRVNIPSSDPTYSAKLDRDGNGLACEA